MLFIEDPYGTFHLTLNANTTGQEAQTEWVNMGYWAETDHFPEACKALAEQVMSAAHCSNGGNVLDVGHACGDSLLMHLCGNFSARQGLLCGITSLPWQHQRALRRLRDCTHVSNRGRVYLYQGDAVYRPPAEKHPSDPSSKAFAFNSITAVDCAYHFRSRTQFLRQSFERLEAGGWIGLADLYRCERVHRPSVWLLCLALGVPAENLWDRERYLDELQTIGFVNCQVRDVSDMVFPKFRHFLKSRGGVWALVEKYGIGLFVRKGGRYAIVSAQRP